MPVRNQQGLRPASRRRWRWLLFGLPLAVLAAGLLLTDGTPAAGGSADEPAPDARQAAAAEQALDQLHGAASGGGPVRISASAAQLAAVAAVASSGLRPDRLALAVDEFGLHATGSHRLPLGRWLNVGAEWGDSADGPPPVTVTIGSVTLPPVVARWAMAVGARLLRARGLAVPDPNGAVRWLRASDDRVSAEIDLTGGAALARAAAGMLGGGEGGAGAAYCRLAASQQRQPAADFSALVRRAFAAPASGEAMGEDPARANRDALVALAMLVVNPKVGMLAGVAPDRTRGCRADASGVTIHGRNDSPKHWLMSAALAVTTGARLSQAAGEWKELADSMAGPQAFRPGDASGFSLVDIGADRAGELIGLAAVDPARADGVRAALARADDDALMPGELLGLSDGMSADAFARTYGSVDDPRYARVRERIDAIVRERTVAGR